MLHLYACLSSQVLENVACQLVANGFSIEAHTQQSNSKKYMAVYSLITAYLDSPVQDYIATATHVSTVLSFV